MPLDEPTRDLEHGLRRVVEGEVRFDSATRAAYSTDASNYRRVPLGVLLPRSTDDVVAAMAVCRDAQVAVLPRGAGTSIGGQACNRAVVLDTTRHLTGIEVDPDHRLATVQPGVVLDDLRAAAAPHGLTFGPDPSTHNRCTLGGMIGNNSCGTHSVAFGRTVDNVESLDVLLYDGTRLTVGRDEDRLPALIAAGGRVGRLYAALAALRDEHADRIRAAFPDLPRRVSGYNLDQLLPEHGLQVARALVGTEGTCATTLGATVRLVPAPPTRALLVVGYPDMAAAAEAVPVVLPHRPVGLEGLGRGVVDCLLARRPGHPAVAALPEGGGWLFVELPGDTAAEALARAEAVAADLRRDSALATPLVVADPAHARELWRVREEGAGLASRLPDGGEAWPGWEDAAVPPARLASYLRGFDALLARHRLRGAAYGHFGEGCVHVRIDFDLRSAAGVAGFRRFVEEAADLVVEHGGSLSGEHGDGQARAELLDRMFPPDLLAAFRRFRAAFDPAGRMNPGAVVDPLPLDADLRLGAGYAPKPLPVSLAYPEDGGDFASATRRCVGVGKCRRDDGGVMCPSWMVTHDERHSTRGRARLLFEMLQGEVVRDGWRSAEVHDALDLCLACKGCRSDCPVQVDMATYKAEFLAQHYKGRLRPAAHYAMGWLPLWAALAGRAPAAVNAALGSRRLGALAKRAGGIAPQRELPRFAPRPLGRRLRDRGLRPPAAGGQRPQVLLWPDTFTAAFDPQVGEAAVRVLQAAGLDVRVPAGRVCCGLTWLSTGQLGTARRVLRATLRRLRPALALGLPVVVLEPSCAALLRGDLARLLPDDPDARRLAAATRTLAEVLREQAPGWRPPNTAVRVLTQVHCHQHAVLGDEADRALLAAAGADQQVLDAGCCGLAGDFGFEAGHYDVSMACAERVLLPAVRQAAAGTVVHADGFSCRTQIRHGAGAPAAHLAEILAAGLPAAVR